MSIKQILKSAKEALGRKDPEAALEFVTEALAEDSQNYIANVFAGKCHELMKNYKKACDYYQRATAIEPDNLLCWKGYYLLAKSNHSLPHFDDKMTYADKYRMFFTVTQQYIEALQNNSEPFTEVVREIGLYLKKCERDAEYEELQEYYLTQIVPGGGLYELCGSLLGDPQRNLHRLIVEVLIPKERLQVAHLYSREKVKYSLHATGSELNSLNEKIWSSILSSSTIGSHYTLLISICDDDEARRAYEHEYLQYQYEFLIKYAPALNGVQRRVQRLIWEMVQGMVLVNHPSLLAWNIYWDWCDPVRLGDLNQDYLGNYLQRYGDEGLGVILYALIRSDISTFDTKRALPSSEAGNRAPGAGKKGALRRNKKQERKRAAAAAAAAAVAAVMAADGDAAVNAEDEFTALGDDLDDLDDVAAAALGDDPEDQSSAVLTQEQVLTLLLDGYTRCSGLVLANRIVSTYYIHLKEFVPALEKTRNAISLLAGMSRHFGLELEYTKEEMLVNLGTIYTFYEAPKNFAKAMQIFDKVLETKPTNVDARVGKGFILIENKELDAAMALFEKVCQEHPQNQTALMELNWCRIMAGDFSGREGLVSALETIVGKDVYSYERRALINWRLAESYTMERKVGEVGAEENGLGGAEGDTSGTLQTAYDYLIASLKALKNFAPSYTSLGRLYADHYRDTKRATKCFYKAFELDAGEVVAAHHLVAAFADDAEWETAAVLAERVVVLEKARRALAVHFASDPSWPYRVLGVASLELQDDAKAIEWFQSSLRLNPGDNESWIGLGEAYTGCGRLESSIKVFNHSLTLDPTNWFARYLLGVALNKTGEHAASAVILRELEGGDRQCARAALYETLLATAMNYTRGGFFGRAVDSALECVEVVIEVLKTDPASQAAWKALADVIALFLDLQEHLSKFPHRLIEELLRLVAVPETEFAQTLPLTAEVLGELEKGLETGLNGPAHLRKACGILIGVCRTALSLLPLKSSKALRACTYFNLGLAYLQSFNQTGLPLLRDASITVLKKAITLESTNPGFWTALGNASLSVNPRISQHCFVKASSYAPSDPVIWTNLAALYLRYGDAELAEETFRRAQSIAPEQSQSWSGHALTAEARGDNALADRLATHAYVLAKGRSPLAHLLFGHTVFKRRLGQADDARDVVVGQEWGNAHHAMTDYLKSYPSDPLGLTLALAIAERCGDYRTGVELGERLAGILEARYEVEESRAALFDLAAVKCLLARLYLGKEEFETAQENAQLVLDLCEEEPDAERCVLSARVVIGLCHFFNNGFDESLHQLKTILERSPESQRLVVLIAQILYAYSQDDTKQAALDQLFAHIEEFGSTLMVALAVGAICVNENMVDYLPAVKEELCNLSVVELASDSFRSVPSLIAEINERLEVKANVWQRSAFLFPGDSRIWNKLSQNVCLQASLLSPNVHSRELSEAYIMVGTVREIQRGLFLDPSGTAGLLALKGCVR